MKKTILFVKGMHCPSCEMLIEGELEKIKEVKNVKATLRTKTVSFIANENPKILIKKINKLINILGYSVSETRQTTQKKYKELLVATSIAFLLILTFVILHKFSLLNFVNLSTANYPAIFLIGVVASTSSCAAVVGGLILSLSANMAKNKIYTNKTVWAFHLSRIISFFILGGLVGLIGKSVSITPQISIFLNILLAVVMLSLGLNLLNVFDFAKKVQFTVPVTISKKFISVSNKSSFYSSMLLGASTFFLPCGFTQSIQMYALSTQNFYTAALVMVTFALGTLPVLMLITLSSKTFSTGKYSEIFFKTAGILVIAFGIFNVYNAMIVAQILK